MKSEKRTGLREPALFTRKKAGTHGTTIWSYDRSYDQSYGPTIGLAKKVDIPLFLC